MKKKLLSLLLSLTMVLALLPATAFAADSDFKLKGTVLERYEGPAGAVVIPDGVTSIGGYAFRNRGVTSVVIPSSVTSIANNAFAQCDTLVSVTIPEGVASIGSSAFSGCSSLKTVTIPSSVTSIGRSAFNGCVSLTSANILGAANVDSQAFNGCTSLQTVAFYNGKARIDSAAFQNCSSLTTIYLPSELNKISGSLFRGCSSLRTLYIPASVTSIEGSCFSSTNLTDIYYEGSESQWKAVTLAWFVSDDVEDAAIHYNSTMPVPAPAFADVPAGEFYADAVSWAVSQNITSGTSATTFSPAAPCSNAEILAFLWRAAGKPSASAGAIAASLSPTDWYYDAAVWAASLGMIDSAAVLTQPCTRADAVRYICIALGGHSNSSFSFSDVPAGALYLEAVSWAVSNGITAGTSATTFSPDLDCTRGQIVTFLYRAYVPAARLNAN